MIPRLSKDKFKRICTLISILLTVLLIVIISYWRIKLGLIRYFDPDELLYPNWAYHILQGGRPYIDFMMIATPLYVLFFLPIVRFWHGIDPLIVGRVAAFVLSLILGGSLAALFYQIRKSWIALIIPAIISILPMPTDKFLEIRPDILAMIFFIIGLIFQIRWMHEKKNSLFWAGFFYALSLLTLQKNLPQICFVMLVVCLLSLAKFGKGSFFRWPFVHFLAGFLVPIGIFLIWAFVFTPNPRLVIYSVTWLPIEHARMYKFTTPQQLYIQPFITYYGQWGYGLGYIFNHLLWITGIIIAFLKILSLPFIKKGIRTQEFIFPVLFFLSIYVYFISPIKFSQYLIPASIFVVLLCTDGIYFLYSKLNRHIFTLSLFTGVYILFLWVGFKTYFAANNIKYWWTNQDLLSKMQEIFATIPKNEYVLDMEGRTMYYPYPYYICCLSFEIPKFISYQLPSLKDALLKTKTKYIYQGPIERIDFLSGDDHKFVNTYYKKIGDGQLLVATKW